MYDIPKTIIIIILCNRVFRCKFLWETQWFLVDLATLRLYFFKYRSKVENLNIININIFKMKILSSSIIILYD